MHERLLSSRKRFLLSFSVRYFCFGLSSYLRFLFGIFVIVYASKLSDAQLIQQQQPQPSTSHFAQTQLADHAHSSNNPTDFFPQTHGALKTPFPDRITCDGVPQEYCTKPGQFYPRNEIGFYIEENRSMMKRMFGSVSSRSLLRKDEEEHAMDNSDLRKKRMTKTQPQLTTYLCPVEEELVTPFWAVNGTGSKLAVVNTAPFEQAIHTVKCARGQVGRCHPTRPCWCTQEYSWFRLLAYDPVDNCKGIFMDWFKFPSHCACKCVQAAQATAAVSVAPNQ